MKMMEVRLDSMGIRTLLRSGNMKRYLGNSGTNVRLGSDRAVSFPKKSDKQMRRSKYINDYRRRKQGY